MNVHLSAEPSEEPARVVEAKTICTYIDSLMRKEGREVSNTANYNEKLVDGVVILGDFNAYPDGPCYEEFVKRGYISAYKAAHGREPDVTFHQNHSCDTKDVGPEACLDYIFYTGCLEIVPTSDKQGSNCALVGTKAAISDETLFPSDHYGIVADLRILQKGK